MGDVGLAAAQLVGVAALSIGLPWVASALAVHAAEGSGRLVENWRGRKVARVLGVAWATWAVAVGVGAFAAGVIATWPSYRWSPWVLLDLAPAFLVLGAAVLGWLDDVRGGAPDRGFRGHLRALRQRRVTTGLAKLLGIGALALFAAWGLVLPEAARSGRPPWARLLVSAALIALTANLANLLDRRPGRALKAYAALVLVTCIAGATPLASPEVRVTGQPGGAASAAGLVAIGALLFLGPAIAVWRYDLTERAMLGDAGANAAGALAGWFLAFVLPLPALAVVAVLFLALNVASERWSFTEVIERNPPLRWLDRVGRPAEDGSGENGKPDGNASRL